jgi:hypothetical protein
MLARNSDLYLEVSASCLAFSSSAGGPAPLPGSCAPPPRSAGQQAGLGAQLLVGLLQLDLARLQFGASCCDCVSRPSVRIVASMVLNTMPIERQLVEEGLVRR